MIRGRMDLLVPTAQGLTIIDYKTDNVTGKELNERAETYSRQMRFYAEAIKKVARTPVSAIQLIFLRPRQIVLVSPDA